MVRLMKRSRIYFLMCLLLASCSWFGGKLVLNRVVDWFILLDYDPKNYPVDAVFLSRFQMGILDSEYYPHFEQIRHRFLAIAYISFGEASDYRQYWDKIKDREFVLEENPNWQGDFYVDIRHEDWQNLILHEEIPAVLEKGFKGIFMDTLDTAIFLEDQDPEKYQGSKTALISLIQQIKAKYPDIYLISNNGFDILPEIAPYLDGVLAEDIFYMIDFKNGGYKPVPENERLHKISILKNIMEKFHLPVFTVDYVSQSNRKTIQWVKKESKKQGFRPYIAEKGLNRIYEQ